MIERADLLSAMPGISPTAAFPVAYGAHGAVEQARAAAQDDGRHAKLESVRVVASPVGSHFKYHRRS